MTQWLRENRVAWPTTFDRHGAPKVWTRAHRVFENNRTYCSNVVPESAVAVDQYGKPGSGKCSRCERMSARSFQNRRDRLAAERLEITKAGSGLR